jgi:molybdenum cofactor cytidylyltransferase
LDRPFGATDLRVALLVWDWKGIRLAVSVLVAILAAGESRRMGRPKLCLPWGQTTILGHILGQWREAGADKILVVHGQGETPVTLELDRLGIPFTHRVATTAPERGMMGSVVTAAAEALWDVSLTHLIIVLGDQPQLQTGTLRKILRACETTPDKMIRVVFEGKPGHPLALPMNVLAELSFTSSETLRDFLRLKEIPACDLTCHDSGVLLDVDTPDDYARASHSVD